MKEKPSYESEYSRINAVIERNKCRYQLNGVAWMDWEDVKQVIRLHIYRKWHMWNPERPLEPWINIICINQIRNIVRNNWSNYARPCLRCKCYQGDDCCSLLISGCIGLGCKEYKKWWFTKRGAVDLKVSYSMADHEEEIPPLVKQEGVDEVILRELLTYLEKKYGEIDRFIFESFFLTCIAEKEIVRKVKETHGVKITLNYIRLKKRELKKDAIRFLTETEIIDNPDGDEEEIPEADDSSREDC